LQDQLMIALLCTGSLCWQVSAISAICGFRLNLHIPARAARDAEVTQSVELRTHYSSRNRTHRQLAHAGYYALKQTPQKTLPCGGGGVDADVWLTLALL